MPKPANDADARAAAYNRVLAFITAERGMRERVFARDPKKLAHKVAECDRALAALDALYLDTPLDEPEAHFERPSLFG